ncbi:hypothetical protein GUJ93_ZPchr0019g2693 [Zizania palustris]|uniref:Uncharacterized protein n=1 Tax=Zizania palustris TaxID=103762 RepID=A0A8J5T834_ZIZPA|nr:hypothetical protein GUJ93_ZPchr0019g2693 [Zizania palustris]
MDVDGSAMPPTECGGALVDTGRSSPSPAASPEFEFWMVGKNPSSFPSPVLLTADELFSDGIVLPLRTLQQVPQPDGDGEGGAEDAVDSSALAPEEGEGEVAQRLAESVPAPTPDLPAVTFKWKDIFKATGGGEAKDRKKMERRVSSVSGNAELININIWPFSRSRSAGHSAGGGVALNRNKSNPSPNANASNAAAASASASAPAAPAPAGRKVSSAPCSRSNSRGESSGPAAAPAIAAAACAAAVAAAPAGPQPTTSILRRLVPGQGRTGLTVTGIRLGRASPVWQLRRNKLQQQAAAEPKHNGNPTTNSSTTSKKKASPVSVDAAATTTTTQDVDGEDKSATSVATAATAGCRNNSACSEAGGEEVNPPQGLFGLRTFFSKKVY